MDNDFKKLEEYFKRAESDHIEFQGYCHDCKKLTKVNADVLEDSTLKITGGSVYFPDIGSGEPTFFVKCDSCFKKDTTLRNYQPCDVYSRVVGFYRPIKSWNEGKHSEWKKRKDYNLPNNQELAV